MAKEFLFIFNQPPYQTLNNQEGLEMALMAGAFDQTINLLFLNQACELLIINKPEKFYRKNFCDILKAREIYNIKNIYCNKIIENPITPYTQINQSDITKIKNNFNIILEF